uniref:Neur_chan_LBD domain-containing protein n=1 Tax=Mesocestoides corti TaxID=53468 RepID=A0A5K3EH21_MESCO
FFFKFLICSLSLVTFSVDKSQPQSRLQLAFTLVLTLVAFKFVVNQCLPKISYLTYLDKYVISSLFFLTIICIWHGGVALIENLTKRLNIHVYDHLELYVIIAISIGYFTFNLGFVLMIYAVACKRRRLMCAKDIKYLERIKCQMKKKGIRQHRTLDQST